ncbi:MAG TPA: hypothetical protein VFR28_10290 [Allosphingosinicella sp.]|jgi:predicted RNase H-like nuclease (RuvC/YqgF family)|nr:hypothetical protein [Allosphingosinicella sp.]
MSDSKKKPGQKKGSSKGHSKKGTQISKTLGPSLQGVTSTDDQARTDAIENRKKQKDSLEEAFEALSLRVGNPGEDEEQLQNEIDRIEQKIFDVDREIQDLRASVSMKFPSGPEISALGNAIDILRARIAASAATSAIAGAAGDVMDAFGI